MKSRANRQNKWLTLVVMRGFDSEIKTNNSGRNIALENDETGVRSQHWLITTMSTMITNSAQFARSYKNAKIAGVDAASNEELMLPRQAPSKASIGQNNNRWWREVSRQQC